MSKASILLKFCRDTMFNTSIFQTKEHYHEPGRLVLSAESVEPQIQSFPNKAYVCIDPNLLSTLTIIRCANETIRENIPL